MFSEYVEKALHGATYDRLEDGTFFAEIPGFDGVWGNGSSIEECRADLRDALEGWLVLGLWDRDDSLPVIDGITLIPQMVNDPSKKKSGTAPASRARKAS